MEVKKSPKANLESRKQLFILMGYVVILAVVFVAFEWAAQNKEEVVDNTIKAEVEVEEEMMAIEINTPPPPPPPPPPPAPVIEPELNIVDDDVEVAKVEIASTEDTGEAVEIVEMAPPPIEEEDPQEEEIFTIVEQMPEFPGGVTELMKFLGKSIKYPVIAQENGIQGRVICTFTVNRDGSIVDAEVVRGVDSALDKEALRVINEMPKWNPGMQRGKAVRVKYTLPVMFRLQ